MEVERGSRGRTRRASEADVPPLDGLAASEPVRAAIGEIGKLGVLGVDMVGFTELFCPGRFSITGGTFNLTPGSAFDLRTGRGLSRAPKGETSVGKHWGRRRRRRRRRSQA